MSAKPLLTALFQYKASADIELLQALASLPDLGANPNVQTALRVLNHAHIVDRIFTSNLEKQPHAYTASWEKEAPPLAKLTSEIRQADQWYLDYLSQVSPDEMDEAVDFTFADGGPGRMSRAEMLGHVITHSGYHRGEVARLLPEIEATAVRDVFAGYLHRAEPHRRRADPPKAGFTPR